MRVDWISDTLVTEITLLGIAFVLSAVVGLERHRRLKSAGLRTHTLVGLGTAVFTLVSAYGFASVVGPDSTLDPSRIAAQIVSGIGFLGAGVIFVRQTTVAGLTTAASIWVTASIGMACGAGQPLLAAVATGLYLVATSLLAKVARRITQHPPAQSLRLRYREGRGALRECLSLTAEHGYEATLTQTSSRQSAHGKTLVEARMSLRGSTAMPLTALLQALSGVPGVRSVALEQPDND